MRNPTHQNTFGRARKHRTQFAVVTLVNAGNLGHQANHVKQKVNDNSDKQRNLNNLINHLTPNGHFSGRTAPLTYRRCIFLFIQQLYVLNILNMLHTLRFFLFKMPFIS
jgi:hypothetical protein